MPYPMKLTCALSGVTPSQLRRLHRKGVIRPQTGDGGIALYSFNDILTLRVFAALRPHISAQKIDKAFAEFRRLTQDESAETLASHRFGTDGQTVYTDLPDDAAAMDLVRYPGQMTVFTFAQMTSEFRDWKGRVVPDLANPRAHLAVDEHRIGGWPTIRGTRIPYDTIAALASPGDLSGNDIRYYYPGVSDEAIADAVDFDRTVQRIAA